MISPLRKACAGLIEKAVRMGACTEKEAWSMTPHELSLAVRCRRDSENDRLRMLDMLAWLVGQYCAVAVNAPSRYPAQPDRVRLRAVGDEQMHKLMRSIAGKGDNGGEV